MDIYTLHRKGYSINAIARKTGVNWRTVKKYITADGERKPYDSGNRASVVMPFVPHIEHWLEEDAYTATWIFDRLKPLGYGGGYDSVKRKVREIKGRLSQRAYLRFETEPGRQAQVDFADFQIEDESGKIGTVYLFVMVLGYSRRMYLELITRRDMTNFLDCHINAFEFFGGVPAEILYDRMKNVLIRQLVGKLEWNREFYSFCLHHRFQPLVAPPYTPWVKGKVERPIRYVRENFWRGYDFRDLESANRDLHAWNLSRESRVHGTTRERVDLRFEREGPELGALPSAAYDTSARHFRVVRKDCTVSFSGNLFVMPHRTVGERLLLRVKNGVLRAFRDDELLVSYRIPEGRGELVQDGRFYDALKNDIEQARRKYARSGGGKGRAKRTLGLTGGTRDTIVVATRSMADYEKAAEG